uniref:RE1-silencing transcription factor A n=2 Tax=Cacopsylla melanoneura TaxID=428564 RepID=A0A8D8SLP2_9HEMI
MESWRNMLFHYSKRIIFIIVHFTDLITCKHCYLTLSNENVSLLHHCKSCNHVLRTDTSFNYVCLFCEYHTHNAGHMSRHIRMHMGEKPFKCTHCTYRSSQKENVVSHIRIKHS